jgi:hypothetical protein
VELVPGSHHVELLAPGYEPLAFDLMIQAHHTIRFAATPASKGLNASYRTLIASSQIRFATIRSLILSYLGFSYAEGNLRKLPPAELFRNSIGRVGTIVAQMAGVAPFVVAVRGIEPRSRG